MTGILVLDGRGRDLLTAPDGSAAVLDVATLSAEIDYFTTREIRSLATEPPLPLDALVGARASSGFRAALDDAVPAERASNSVRYQLLDDVPTATLVSGYSVGAGGVHVRREGAHALQVPDLCAGWATDATILREMERTGHPPVVTGPDAPALEDPDDPLAWHELPALAAHTMRRRRRIDVWRVGDEVAGECYFRDSHMSEEGHETVIHEYTVDFRFDPSAGVFVAVEATANSLPWIECPDAAPSAGRLAGAAARDLRPWVRETFLGPSTCTHLNDTLRSMADVGALAARLPWSA